MSLEANIKDSSTGRLAKVTENGQLEVRSESVSRAHFISHAFGQAYQTHGRTGTLTAATHTVLHLRNDDPSREMVISSIRVQLIGANASDAITDYFEFGFGRTVSSGGSTAVTTNLNRQVGTVALATTTTGSPTMAGTFASIERWYPAASGEQDIFNEDGAIILGLNDTFEIRYVSTATTGIAEARIEFLMDSE